MFVKVVFPQSSKTISSQKNTWSTTKYRNNAFSFRIYEKFSHHKQLNAKLIFWYLIATFISSTKFCIFVWITITMTSKEIIIGKLKQYRRDLSNLGVREIGLFGSYLRNEQTSKSDIDILVDFEPEQENFDNYMAVYDLLERIFTNQNVQIVTKNGMSPHIGPKILKEVMYA